MATLDVREVSEEVAEKLKNVPRPREGRCPPMWLLELTKLAGRPSNAEIVARLKSRDRSKGPASREIMATVKASRR